MCFFALGVGTGAGFFFFSARMSSRNFFSIRLASRKRLIFSVAGSAGVVFSTAASIFLCFFSALNNFAACFLIAKSFANFSISTGLLIARAFGDGIVLDLRASVCFLRNSAFLTLFSCAATIAASFKAFNCSLVNASISGFDTFFILN